MKVKFELHELADMKKNLLNEFNMASQGKKTSLAYALHEFNPEKKISESARAIVIGGTNMSAADVKRNGINIKADNIFSEALPVIDSAEKVFDIIEKVSGEADRVIGINFAYPMRPVVRAGRLDGILIKGTKEHSFEGMVGREVGAAVEDFFTKQGKKTTVTCANDTVCLVLAGLSGYDPSTLAAGVVGTGFNFGFFNDENVIVNLESGNFSGFTPTGSCKIIDGDSRDPGEQIFEKETSGAYLHLHYNIIASEKGNATGGISSSEELSEAASVGDSLARSIFEKSASLVAVEIAAIYEFRAKPVLNLTIEGSLYWKGWNYKNNVNRYLESLGIPGGAVNIRHIEDSSIIGAAELVV